MREPPIWENDPVIKERVEQEKEKYSNGQAEAKRAYRNGPDAEPDLVLPLKSAAAYAPRKIEWQWNGYLPKGKFVLLAGEKTAGKSTIGFNLAAILTAGGRWPDGTQATCGDVIIWSGEDDFEDTILPRFLAAGGDQNRLYPVTYVVEKGKERAFDPSTDVEALRAAAKQLPDLGMTIIDPIALAIPSGADSYKNAETRRGLQPLVDFAAEYKTLLLGIAHFNKNSGEQNPIDRINGSLAFGAIPRVLLGAATDPEGKHRRLVRIASNIGPSGGGVEFLLYQDPLPGYDFSAQRITWGAILQGPAKDLLEMKGQSEMMRACQFLLDQLADRPVAVKDLKDAALANGGGTWRTIERAKEHLGTIKASKVGKIWFWSLKPDSPRRSWNN
jgi:hypothetical protein